MIQVVLTYDEAARKWDPVVHGAKDDKEAKQAFAAAVLSCQDLDPYLLAHAVAESTGDGLRIIPAVRTPRERPWYSPFSLVRLGPLGPDTHEHTFCAAAKGNIELVRTGESDERALINGASGHGARTPVRRFVNALNAVFVQYMEGRFHDV